MHCTREGAFLTRPLALAVHSARFEFCALSSCNFCCFSFIKINKISCVSIEIADASTARWNLCKCECDLLVNYLQVQIWFEEAFLLDCHWKVRPTLFSLTPLALWAGQHFKVCVEILLNLFASLCGHHSNFLIVSRSMKRHSLPTPSAQNRTRAALHQNLVWRLSLSHSLTREGGENRNGRAGSVRFSELRRLCHDEIARWPIKPTFWDTDL